MDKIKSLILVSAALVGFAFLPLIVLAQETSPSGGYEACAAYVASENPVKVALAIGFLAVLVIFAFMKKSVPQAIKDIAAKLLGGSSKP